MICGGGVPLRVSSSTQTGRFFNTVAVTSVGCQSLRWVQPCPKFGTATTPSIALVQSRKGDAASVTTPRCLSHAITRSASDQMRAWGNSSVKRSGA
ncbi:hypothetical protein HRbin17_02736 [bacterium HR17]|uniref:Uncharacterized protein n=1 Tax=Candidatus Fervidibacter japonicus TaxID=2035412 RepID=A0A2H5XGB0_9BACT|nr:hypothetical protein HRbin17_02736 [bacterium HR17]